MANQRVLVMNGQRLLETATDDGKWKVAKVDTAPAGMKPGIYNIGNAKPAAKDKVSEGVIIHADAQAVYQQVGKAQFVKHDTAAFEKVPAIGSTIAVTYNGNKATAGEAKGLSRGRSL